MARVQSQLAVKRAANEVQALARELAIRNAFIRRGERVRATLEAS